MHVNFSSYSTHGIFQLSVSSSGSICFGILFSKRNHIWKSFEKEKCFGIFPAGPECQPKMATHGRPRQLARPYAGAAWRRSPSPSPLVWMRCGRSNRPLRAPLSLSLSLAQPPPLPSSLQLAAPPLCLMPQPDRAVKGVHAPPLPLHLKAVARGGLSEKHCSIFR